MILVPISNKSWFIKGVWVIASHFIKLLINGFLVLSIGFSTSGPLEGLPHEIEWNG